LDDDNDGIRFDPEDPDFQFDPEDEETVAQLRKLDQDRVNDSQREWLMMYGFPHECSCAADMENDNTQAVAVCYLGAAEEAFDHLRRTRAFLYAIATSPTKEASILKALAAEAFGG
jgi:hypothetical protein